MSHLPLTLTLLAGLILTAGDIILKKWVVTSFPAFYVSGLVLYFISMNLLAYSFKFENVAVASMLMVIFNIITLVLVEYFFFNENITIYEISGIILGFAALALLEIGKK